MVPVVTVVQDGANSFAPFAKEIYEGGQGAAANPGSQIYPLVNIQKAIKNYHLYSVFPWKMVVFHSYVKLPEGRSKFDPVTV